MIPLSRRIAIISTLLSAVTPLCQAFVVRPPIAHDPGPSYSSAITTTTTTTTTTTRLGVFDFFRQRTAEGFQQLNNLADASYKGELKRGFADMASYTATTNQAFANGLSRSRAKLLQNLEALWTGINPEALLDELEDVLLQADLGAQTSEDILAEVRSFQQANEGGASLLSRDDLMSILRGKLVEALEVDPPLSRAIRFADPSSGLPTVVFVMGANGMGKTTTIGKLAHRLRVEGNQTVLLAACDTFRAGAVEQLEQWALRAGVDVVGPDERATTPAAVLYRALDRAVRDQRDVLLVDTSGRLSNNDALTMELAKMKRVIQKRLSVATDDATGQPVPNLDVPHETLLVLDAAQGRMALDSARVWNREIGLTGLILTKLDGSARGGSVVAVSRDLQLPVKLIGVGEGMDDLRDFEPELFVDSLLGIGPAGGKATSMSSASGKDEGRMLADRLAAMRQERDFRAKERAAVRGVGATYGVSPPPPPASSKATAAATASQPSGPVKPNRPKHSKKKRKAR